MSSSVSGFSSCHWPYLDNWCSDLGSHFPVRIFSQAFFVLSWLWPPGHISLSSSVVVLTLALFPRETSITAHLIALFSLLLLLLYCVYRIAFLFLGYSTIVYVWVHNIHLIVYMMLIWMQSRENSVSTSLKYEPYYLWYNYVFFNIIFQCRIVMTACSKACVISYIIIHNSTCIIFSSKFPCGCFFLKMECLPWFI